MEVWWNIFNKFKQWAQFHNIVDRDLIQFTTHYSRVQLSYEQLKYCYYFIKLLICLNVTTFKNYHQIVYSRTKLQYSIRTHLDVKNILLCRRLHGVSLRIIETVVLVLARQSTTKMYIGNHTIRYDVCYIMQHLSKIIKCY